MRYKGSALFIGFFSLLFLNGFTQSQFHHRELILMGDRFEITAVHEDSTLCRKAVDAAIAEISRIENLISEWKPDSETSKVNDNAGIQPVSVSIELFDLIFRSVKVSRLTGGAFDITFAPMNNIYKFDKQEHPLPSQEQISEWKQKVGFRNIVMDETYKTVFLPEKGMKIGFGGIGQGYAANRAKEVMLKTGIENGVVNASGDILAWGKRDDGKDWEVGIGNPKNPKEHIAWLKAADIAVTTSGNYEKYFLSNGIRHGHVIDPRTGYPSTGLKSVTIICPDAELADALDTAVFVLGEKDGLKLAEQLKDVECIIINDRDEVATTSGIQLNYYSTNQK